MPHIRYRLAAYAIRKRSLTWLRRFVRSVRCRWLNVACKPAVTKKEKLLELSMCQHAVCVQEHRDHDMPLRVCSRRSVSEYDMWHGHCTRCKAVGESLGIDTFIFGGCAPALDIDELG